jgi:hypothetical protein
MEEAIRLTYDVAKPKFRHYADTIIGHDDPMGRLFSGLHVSKATSSGNSNLIKPTPCH